MGGYLAVIQALSIPPLAGSLVLFRRLFDARGARFATELLRFPKAGIMHPVILRPNHDGFLEGSLQYVPGRSAPSSKS
ncbi:uncharacterized protein LY79DRAFT_552833 [Colletotrichum navitas]|uniref:Uncharacterized protein n=1 Tax=Colletotrichum navitas TaxID=681940 RepID=A0AAD8Q0I2_9PEZI|nr:uncharacterized protein LY79DRAFT_552833 [Colletotrichum navitas]KAK1593125.1 hypothetical protein LY79DRAFT_552833 [Colletotrichum navitas]